MDPIEILEQKIKSGVDGCERIDTLNALAWELRFDDVARALTLSETARELADQGEVAQQPYLTGLAESLRNLGHCYERLDNYHFAISLLLEALSLFEQIGNQAQQATVLYLLGGNYWSIGNYVEALAYTLASLEKSRAWGDRYSEAKGLNIVGLIYQSVGDFTQAMSYFLKAHSIYEEIDHKRGQGDTLSNIGEVFFELGDYENALSNGLTSLQLHQEIGYVRDIGIVCAAVGRVYLALQQPQQALKTLYEGLDISQESGNLLSQLRCRIYLGEVYYQQHEFSQALSFLQQALPLAQQIGTQLELYECYHLLSKVYKQVGDFEQALALYEQFQQTKENVLTELAKHKLHLLDMAYGAELAKKEVETQRVKNSTLEHEIAERTRAEELLSKNEVLLQAIINNTVASVYVLDPQSRVLLVNDYFVNLFGLQVDKVIGMSVNDLFPTELADFFFRTNLEVLNAKTAIQFEEVVSLPSGEHTFMTSKFPLLDASGSIYAICGLSTDISERKQMEEALSASEDRLRHVLSAISDHIYVTEFTRDGKRLNRFLSPIESLTGYPMQKVMADWSFWPSTLIHPDDRDRAAHQLECFTQGRNSEVEYRLVRADGRVIWVRDNGQVERDPITQHILVYGVVGDITERKKAEAERSYFTNQLRAVAEISQQISAILEPEELLEQVVTLLQLRFGLFQVHLYLLHELAAELVLRAGSGEVARRLIAQGHKISMSAKPSVVAQAARDRKLICINEVFLEPGFLAHPFLPQIKAEVAVPIMAATKVLGVLDIHSDQPNYFRPSDLDTYQTLVGQIGIALDNARLFEEQKRIEQNLVLQERRLRTLYEITALAGLDASQQFQTALEFGTALLNMNRGIISRVDQDVYTVLHCYAPGGAVTPGQTCPLEQTYCSLTLASKEVVALNHTAVAPKINVHSCYQDSKVEAYLGVPLWVEGEMFGTLNFSSSHPRNTPFTPADQDFVRLMAEWVSRTIERQQAEEALKQSNQRLQQVLGQLQNRVVELLTLNQIIQTVTTVTDLPVALQTVIDLVGQLFKARFATIALLSPDKSELVVASEYAKSSPDQQKLDYQSILGLRILITEGSYSQEVIQKKRAVVFTNAQNHPQTASVHELLRQRGTHCLMIVPLLARGFVLGTIGIDIDQPERIFTAGEVRLAETIAGQIAGAIEIAQLFTQEQQHRRLAEEASQLKSQLLAKISHELRTPLGSILGYTELLAEGSFGSVNPQQREIMSEVIDSTHYLTSLVNELLDQAQFESGNLKLNISNFAPKNIVAQIQARMKILARQKGLDLACEIDPQLPEVITGDPIRLQQVLINLVSNAIKFSQTGGVKVRLLRSDQAHWSLQVADTGPGIPLDAQAYIFEPFRQMDDSVTRAHRGAGLGLAIVKQLTTLMGGQITLLSEVGAGSTFTILLPLDSVNETIK